MVEQSRLERYVLAAMNSTFITLIEGKLKGIKLALGVYIIHLLFVDDVLFGRGSMEEWSHLYEIINLFLWTCWYGG